MRVLDRVELAARRALDDKELTARGLVWYNDAFTWICELSEQYGPNPKLVTGVVAAMSPQVSWEAQVQHMPMILDHWTAFKAIPNTCPGFNRNKRKAEAILGGEDPRDVLSGPKVTAFYSALMGDANAVTIDRHIYSLAYGVDPPWQTAKRIRMVDAAYKATAALLGYTPRETQAITWLWWKDRPEERF